MLSLPKRLFVPGDEPLGLERINKHCSLKLVDQVENALGDDFETIEESFLGPIVKMARNHKRLSFSRNLVHQLLQRRILAESKALWFSFGEQPMRFSLREFFLTTNLPCAVEGESTRVLKKKKKKNNDKWMTNGQTVKSLITLLEKRGHSMSSNQKIRLGATILVEGILVANNPVNQITVENLLRAEDFGEFCSLPWGNIAFNSLVEGVKAVSVDMLKREQYGLSGFCYAIQLWALSSVKKLGEMLGTKDDESAEFPLCLRWTHTKSPIEDDVKMIADGEKVDVRCVIGDPALHSNLVEDTDPLLEKFLDLLNQGYRMKRSDWLKGSVDIKAAVEAVKKLSPDQTSFDSKDDKIEYLSNLVVVLEKRVKHLEHLLEINQQSQEPFGQQEGLEESEVLVSYINRQKKRKRKTKEGEGGEKNTEHELNLPQEVMIPTDAHEPETAGGEASNPQEVVAGENTESELNMHREHDDIRDEREIDEEEWAYLLLHLTNC